MAEVFREFAVPLTRQGVAYRAEVQGRSYGPDLWEGWIEFVPLQGPGTLRSPRETTQPTRNALRYWSEGLSSIYLDGAFNRAVAASGRQPDAPGVSLTDPATLVPHGAPEYGAEIERLIGHGVILHNGAKVDEAEYDIIITPPQLRGTGLTYEAGLPGSEPTNVPDVTGRLLGPLFEAEQYAEDVHTLVLSDGRTLDFRVIQPDTNEIVAVSGFHSPAANRPRHHAGD